MDRIRLWQGMAAPLSRTKRTSEVFMSASGMLGRVNCLALSMLAVFKPAWR